METVASPEEGGRQRSVRMPTPWGELPVVSIPDLVELKKTNRPADYDVITRLAMIRLGQAEAPRPALLRWALDHVFRLEDLLELLLLFRTLPAATRSLFVTLRCLMRGETHAEIERLKGGGTAQGR